jgi:hypothetical protein
MKTDQLRGTVTENAPLGWLYGNGDRSGGGGVGAKTTAPPLHPASIITSSSQHKRAIN